MRDLATVEAYLHKHIPISRELGCRVLGMSAEEILLEAPLEPNINHRATAFGGSLSALAILAGWALVHFRLRGDGVEVRTVIQESRVRYEKPVRGPFQARCTAPADDVWDRFVRTVVRRGKGRIQVDVELTSDGCRVAGYTGTYVALERSAADAGRPKVGLPPA